MPSWPYPPARGWTADDLDHVGAEGPYGELDLLKRVELVDGALIIMSPQTAWHRAVIVAPVAPGPLGATGAPWRPTGQRAENAARPPQDLSGCLRASAASVRAGRNNQDVFRRNATEHSHSCRYKCRLGPLGISTQQQLLRTAQLLGQ